MKWKTLFLGFIAFLTFTGSAFCSDWKFAGSGNYKDKYNDPDRVDFYYDLESLKVRDGRIKIWLETILVKDEKDYITMPYKSKPLYANAEAKKASGYIPEYIKYHPSSAIDIDTVILYEEIANAISDIDAKMLWEIDCEKQEFRVVDYFDKRNSKFEPSKWKDIPPDSMADYIAKIKCMDSKINKK